MNPFNTINFGSYCLWLAQPVIQNGQILVWCWQSIAEGGKNKAGY